MNNFSKYLSYQKINVDLDRIACLFVQKNLDPNWYINRYLEALDNDGLIMEGWLGNFFTRLGNAWNGFWEDPNSVNDPLNRLENAKKSLQSLVSAVQKQSYDKNVINVILHGLEQSLNILDKVDPYIKKLPREDIKFHQDPSNQLPDELHNKFVEIMQRRDMLVKLPNSTAKLTNLEKNDEEWLQFRQSVEDKYRQINPQNQQQQEFKEKIRNFLTRIDTDASFVEVGKLLDFAKRRTQNNLSVSSPVDYKKVISAWQGIQATDVNQRRIQLIRWYQSLPENDSIKQFIQNDIKENPGIGNELKLFWKYAQEWINKMPHYLSN